MKNERGFSLIEVMIAMIILTIGVVGLAGTARGITVMAGSGVRSAESAALANSRLDIIRMTPCASMTSGTATSGAYTLTWRITTNATYSDLRDVALRVTYTDRNATRAAVYETQVTCTLPVA